MHTRAMMQEFFGNEFLTWLSPKNDIYQRLVRKKHE